VEIRAFRRDDARALAALSAACARGETDFVLNPMWEEEADLFAEFERHGVDPVAHLLVADEGVGEAAGVTGFLRRPGEAQAGLVCPIVERALRGRGLGGRLLRAALELGAELGLSFASAGVGTRNRAGYSLLTAHGFRPVRQVYLMRCDERPKPDPVPAQDLALEPARSDDAAAIHEIYAACGFEPRSLERMREVLADGRHAHGVARRDGVAVGFVELETHWPARPWVAYVGVRPELRDRGLGTALVAWALERQFGAGARAGQLLLSPANRSALRAYEKVGFRRHRLLDVLERELGPR
jgi:ribosomal protein S18 acetylase RimI-like enzyme